MDTEGRMDMRELRWVSGGYDDGLVWSCGGAGRPWP